MSENDYAWIQVVLRLDNPIDVIRLSACNRQLRKIAKLPYIWKKLALSHHSQYFPQQRPVPSNNADLMLWKDDSHYYRNTCSGWRNSYAGATKFERRMARPLPVNYIVTARNQERQREKSYCQGCYRQPNICLCATLPSQQANNSNVKLIVLVHPKCETKLGTVHIIEKTFKDVSVFVDYSFAQGRHPQLDRLLEEDRLKYVLFPDQNAIQVEDLQGKIDKPITLIILDGTWAHAKYLWRWNPILYNIQAIGIKPEVPGIYGQFRKEPAENCLSTAEATSMAVQGLDAITTRSLADIDLLQTVQVPIQAMMDYQFEWKNGKYQSKKLSS